MPTPSLSQKILSQYAGSDLGILHQLMRHQIPEIEIRPCVTLTAPRACFLAFCHHSRFQLAYVDLDQAVRISGISPNSLGLVLFQRSTLVQTGGHTRKVGRMEPILIEPRRHLDLTLPRQVRFYFLQLIPPQAADPDQSFAKADQNRNRQLGKILARTLLAGLNQVKYCPTAKRRKHVLDNLGQTLLDRWNGLDAGNSTLSSGSTTTPARLQQISDFIEQHPRWHYDPDTLCELAEMSLRNLYYSFERDFGTTPFRFHRICKLARVRLSLLRDPSLDHPIAWHATNEGFFHLSRFADQYRQLFGELPSTTIRRIQLLEKQGCLCVKTGCRNPNDCGPRTCQLWSDCLAPVVRD